VVDSLRLLSSLATLGQQGQSTIKQDDIKLTVEANTIRIAVRIKEADLKKAYQMQMARNGLHSSSLPTIAAEKPRPPADLGLIIQSSERDMGTVVLPPVKKD
jgi:hypothetical protein